MPGCAWCSGGGEEGLAVAPALLPTPLVCTSHASHPPVLPLRSHLFIPLADAEAAAPGKRAAFVADEHSKRRLVVLLPDGQELPEQLGGRPGGGGAGGPHRGGNQAFVGELMRRGTAAVGRPTPPHPTPNRACPPPRSCQAGGRAAAGAAHRRAHRHLVRARREGTVGGEVGLWSCMDAAAKLPLLCSCHPTHTSGCSSCSYLSEAGCDMRAAIEKVGPPIVACGRAGSARMLPAVPLGAWSPGTLDRPPTLVLRSLRKTGAGSG